MSIKCGSERAQKLYDAVQRGERVYAYVHWGICDKVSNDPNVDSMDDYHMSCGVKNDDEGIDDQCGGFTEGIIRIPIKAGKEQVALIEEATYLINDLDTDGNDYWLSPCSPDGSEAVDYDIYTYADLHSKLATEREHELLVHLIALEAKNEMRNLHSGIQASINELYTVFMGLDESNNWVDLLNGIDKLRELSDIGPLTRGGM